MEMIEKKIAFYDWTPELIPAFVYKGDDSKFLFCKLPAFNWFSQYIEKNRFDEIDWDIIHLNVTKLSTRKISSNSDFLPVLKRLNFENFDFGLGFVVKDIISIYSFFSFLDNYLSRNNTSFLNAYEKAKDTFDYKKMSAESKKYISEFSASQLANNEERFIVLSTFE